jgi:hypothetical protein
MLATLARMESLLARNPLISAKLESSLMDMSEEVSPVLRYVLISSATYAFQNFGFCVFSELGSKILCHFISAKTHIDEDWLSVWLESTATSLLEEQAILGNEIFDVTPLRLNDSFISEVLKRTYCCELHEESNVGFDFFAKEILSQFRKIASFVLNEDVEESQIRRFCAENQSIVQWKIYPFLESIFSNALEKKKEILEEPLTLLFWRMNCFYDSRLVNECTANEMLLCLPSQVWPSKFSASQMCAALSLLLPFSSADKEVFLPNSPISVSEIQSVIFGKKSARTCFDSRFFQTWLADLGTKLEFGAQLAALYNELKSLGFVFEQKKKIGKNNINTYALTIQGLNVVEPFRKMIQDQLVLDSYMRDANTKCLVVAPVTSSRTETMSGSLFI